MAVDINRAVNLTGDAGDQGLHARWGDDPDRIGHIYDRGTGFCSGFENLHQVIPVGPGRVHCRRLRTFNGPALVERCYRAWHNQSDIHLHYRNEVGMEQTAPILAARNVETTDGHVLLLWVYLDSEKVKLEYDSGDSSAAG